MPGSRSSLLCILTVLFAAGGAGVVRAELHTDGEHAADSAAARPLPFFYDLYTFRGRAGGTSVVAAYAVEAGNLETAVVDSRVRYRFSVTLVLADTLLRSVSNTHDTVHVDVPRAMPDDHLLYTHVEVQAPPSGTTLHRVLMTDATTPGVGQLYSEYFPIPDYSGTHLMLSDIALGQPGADAGWTRGDVTLALLPTTQFPSSAFDVYYEIYNLPADREYSTEIAIQHLDAVVDGSTDDRSPVSLRFTGTSPAGAGTAASLPELRRVSASLPKGSYRLTVTITDLTTSAAASRSRTFEVHNTERGATMVPALPMKGGHK